MVNSILPLTLTKAFVQKRGKPILQDIDLHLGKEGFTVLMGPNGSGKTTLLRLLHGLEKPRSGSIDWNVAETEARTRQAFVFQTPVVMRRSVLENIVYPLIVKGETSSNARTRALEWVKTIGLGDRENLNAHFLSGGERQKLAIARALISKPEVLFLDEPTTNLDGRSTKEIEAIILTAHQNGTRIILTTHDIGQAKRLATDVVFLNQGKLCEQGDAKAFFERPKTTQAQAYLRGDIVE